ncbi:MAG: hypothetical protein JW953_09655 [Anaerolineae bacterium]|nr:hypothetical protein [Anaerolineae bacterium]
MPNLPPHKHQIAYFVTPHGFGHAARAAAVMAALRQLEPGIRFEVFSKVPTWFFENSLGRAFNYHSLLTDIGLAQKNSLAEDLPETLRRLADFLPFDPAFIKNLAQQVNQLGCRLILCDIAPLGLAVAKAAGVPGVLIENFTWDWIYQGYAQDDGRINQYILYLQKLFAGADYHIQTEPVCAPGNVDLTTPPVSRKIRTPSSQVRRELGIPAQAKAVLVTMGGSFWQYTFLGKLESQNGFYFVVPGPGQQVEHRGKLVLLPHHSRFFHPDLVNACDAVIGKIGYSTIAEAHHAGTPFGYIARPKFRESQVLVDYITSQMNGIQLTETQFQNAEWLLRLPDLLALPRLARRGPNGADQVADFVQRLLAAL